MDGPGVIRAGNGAKIAGPEVSADTALRLIADELRVVPDVEELRAELQIAAPLLVEPEVLKEREIPVVPTGAPDGVALCVPPRARRCRRVDGFVEPLVDGMRVVG